MLWESYSYGGFTSVTGKLKQAAVQAVGKLMLWGSSCCASIPEACMLCRLHSCSLPHDGPCSSLHLPVLAATAGLWNNGCCHLLGPLLVLGMCCKEGTSTTQVPTPACLRFCSISTLLVRRWVHSSYFASAAARVLQKKRICLTAERALALMACALSACSR